MAKTPGQTIVLWGTRGGVGTTVAAIQLAFQHPQDVTLIDLGGNLDITLGLGKSPDGILELRNPRNRTTDEILTAAAVQVAPSVRIIPYGGRDQGDVLGDGPLADLAEWIRTHEGILIVDAGTGPPPPALAEVADDSIAVTRLSIVDAYRLRWDPTRPTGVIVVEHPEAWLTTADIETAAGESVYARMPYDPNISHAIDTGMFLNRHPNLAQLDPLPNTADRLRFRHSERPSGDATKDKSTDGHGTSEVGMVTTEGDRLIKMNDIWTVRHAHRPWWTWNGYSCRIDNPTLPDQDRIHHLMQQPRDPDRGRQYRERWSAALPARRGPDVDFGQHWQSRDRHDRWRASWNSGSGELHTVNKRTNVVTVLGTFTTQAEVERVIDGWPFRHADEDGLEWLDAAVQVALTNRLLFTGPLALPTLHHPLPTAQRSVPPN